MRKKRHILYFRHQSHFIGRWFITACHASNWSSRVGFVILTDCVKYAISNVMGLEWKNQGHYLYHVLYHVYVWQYILVYSVETAFGREGHINVALLHFCYMCCLTSMIDCPIYSILSMANCLIQKSSWVCVYVFRTSVLMSILHMIHC